MHLRIGHVKWTCYISCFYNIDSITNIFSFCYRWPSLDLLASVLVDLRVLKRNYLYIRIHAFLKANKELNITIYSSLINIYIYNFNVNCNMYDFKYLWNVPKILKMFIRFKMFNKENKICVLGLQPQLSHGSLCVVWFFINNIGRHRIKLHTLVIIFCLFLRFVLYA